MPLPGWRSLLQLWPKNGPATAVEPVSSWDDLSQQRSSRWWTHPSEDEDDNCVVTELLGPCVSLEHSARSSPPEMPSFYLFFVVLQMLFSCRFDLFLDVDLGSFFVFLQNVSRRTFTDSVAVDSDPNLCMYIVAISLGAKSAWREREPNIALLGAAGIRWEVRLASSSVNLV